VGLMVGLDTSLTHIAPTPPTTEQLQKYAPIHIWDEAVKQAKRSDHTRHKTGCVLYTKQGEVIGRGCSHTHDGGLHVRSMHAEADAINRQKFQEYPRELYALVVTLTRSGGFAKISKPCAGCAKLLSHEVETVTFLEQANDRSWTVLQLAPSLLTDLSETRCS
jgi:deoxycytidylate deaminase